MPFWPFYMAACVALFALRRGGAAPLVLLAGLIATRAVDVSLQSPWHEVAALTVWGMVSLTLLLMHNYLLCVLTAVSALAYALVIFGVHVERLGVVAVISDAAFVVGVVYLAFGGGGHNQRGGADRSGHHLASDHGRMAKSYARTSAPDGGAR